MLLGTSAINCCISGIFPNEGGSPLPHTPSVDTISIRDGTLVFLGCRRLDCTVSSPCKVQGGKYRQERRGTLSLSSISSNFYTSIFARRSKHQMLGIRSPAFGNAPQNRRTKMLDGPKGVMKIFPGVQFYIDIVNLSAKAVVLP